MMKLNGFSLDLTELNLSNPDLPRKAQVRKIPRSNPQTRKQ